MPPDPAHRLPYEKQLLETLAACVVGAVIRASRVEMQDTGQGSQIHDFDIVDEGGLTRHVEVTTAMDSSQNESLAAILQRSAALLAQAHPRIPHLIPACTIPYSSCSGEPDRASKRIGGTGCHRT